MTRKCKSGFTRNDSENRPRYDLIPTWVLERLGNLYADGANKFGEHNWELANADEDYNSFKASMMRHMIQYVNSEENEDHFARIIFNLVGCEHVKRQQK